MLDTVMVCVLARSCPIAGACMHAALRSLVERVAEDSEELNNMTKQFAVQCTVSFCAVA